MKIQRALLSVSDKTGLVEFARELAAMGVELLSTGGTAALLKKENIPATEVSAFTGSPEILDGRVKTLHPKIHGGLLYLRGNKDQRKQAEEHGILPIDLVVVNLYPFEETVAKPEVTLEEAIENIDIGGPPCSAAPPRITAPSRSWSIPRITRTCWIICATMMAQPRSSSASGSRSKSSSPPPTTTPPSRISSTSEQETTCSFSITLPIAARLRYGENPHQQAALYGNFDDHFEKLHGKELSFNNILDISAATQLIEEFSEPTVAILKHTNPCGVGSDPDLKAAWDKAFATDKQAPFGGIIICNRPITEPLARAICEIFSEVIIAPDFDPDARVLLQKKKNLRLMRKLCPAASQRGRPPRHPLRARRAAGAGLRFRRDRASWRTSRQGRHPSGRPPRMR